MFWPLELLLYDKGGTQYLKYIWCNLKCPVCQDQVYEVRYQDLNLDLDQNFYWDTEKDAKLI